MKSIIFLFVVLAAAVSKAAERPLPFFSQNDLTPFWADELKGKKEIFHHTDKNTLQRVNS